MPTVDAITSPLPAWAHTIRPQQVQAVAEIVEAYRRGVRVVCLDAPPGAGKTLIAELVRRELGISKGTYIAHSLSLQDQFLGDFDYAATLKGRANYPTEYQARKTAMDCQGPGCRWCEQTATCPYQMAKRRAFTAEVAVLNTAYAMSFQSPAFLRRLVVVDEADTLEDGILRHYEYVLTRQRLKTLGLEVPARSIHKVTIKKWLQAKVLPALERELKHWESVRDIGFDDSAPKKIDAARRHLEATKLLAMQIIPRRWVREYPANGAFVMRPVEVSKQGPEVLWGRSKSTKWLAMSGTFIDPAEWADSTGVTAAGLKWDVVSVPMEWDRANRPIIGRTYGNMGSKGTESGRARVMAALVDICTRHRAHGENVLVHCVNYNLMEEITAALGTAGIEAHSYGSARDRDRALEAFKSGGGVIVAPSLDRGIDLPDELCRVVVVAKMPYRNLGDRQISERLHLPDGNRWYHVQAARSLVQMTGRGLRHADDRCVTYVLDAAFDEFYRKWSRLLPRWWRDSIVGDLPGDWWRN